MKHHWRSHKILSLDEATERSAQLRAEGLTIVSLNGSFDLLHAGHLDILEEAKQQGDVLFVGLNSDISVRDGKGSSRPLIAENERAAMLAALQCTDYIVILDTPYREAPHTFLRAVRPHVHVNGSEYGLPEDWIEFETLRELGVRGYVCERRPGLATSEIIAKIKDEL